MRITITSRIGIYRCHNKRNDKDNDKDNDNDNDKDNDKDNDNDIEEAMGLNYSKLLANKFAVVTCGDTGVGAAIVRLFAEHGATVAFGARDESIATSVIRLINGISPESFYYPCDLSVAESVESFCAEINRQRPLVHALINNPWFAWSKPFEDSDEEDDALIFQVYQRSIMQTLRAFWPAMLDAGGCAVVNISSESVVKPVQGALMQTMANGAIGGMTRVPAVEGGAREVRVNEIYAPSGLDNAPAFTLCSEARLDRTARSESSGNEQNDTVRSESSGIGRNDVACATNVQRDIACVANAALFLSSDMSSYISGISLSVSGGSRRMRFA